MYLFQFSAKLLIRGNYKYNLERTNGVIIDKFVALNPNPYVDQENLVLLTMENSPNEGGDRGVSGSK